MPRNGSGVFTPPVLTYPPTSGDTILVSDYVSDLNDISVGLTASIAVTGESVVLSNIPFSANRLTGIGNPVARGDAINLGSVQDGTGRFISAGNVTIIATDEIAINTTPPVTALVAGMMLSFIAKATNVGPVKITLSGLVQKDLTKNGAVALSAGEIIDTGIVIILFDGIQFQLVNPVI